YDANGNVAQLLDPAATTLSSALIARYEYDAYGSLATSGGSYATTNTWRFSTKCRDIESALGYWGYRWRGSERWLSRDPLGEVDHSRLFCFAGNDAITHIDALGDITIIRDRFRYSGPKGCGGFDVFWQFKLDRPAPCFGYFVQKVELFRSEA